MLAQFLNCSSHEHLVIPLVYKKRVIRIHSRASTILFVFVFLKLKESERTMDTLNTKRETQTVKSSVVDIPRANSFQQT